MESFKFVVAIFSWIALPHQFTFSTKTNFCPRKYIPTNKQNTQSTKIGPKKSKLYHSIPVFDYARKNSCCVLYLLYMYVLIISSLHQNLNQIKDFLHIIIASSFLSNIDKTIKAIKINQDVSYLFLLF